MTSEPDKQFHDEAESIRRTSPGDCQNASSGGANAKASIDGSFWIAIVAVVMALMSIAAVWWIGIALMGQVSVLAERADKAERSAALSREYAVAAFFQTQVEWAKRGVMIQSPLEHHDPIPEKAYQEHEAYLEAKR